MGGPEPQKPHKFTNENYHIKIVHIAYLLIQVERKWFRANWFRAWVMKLVEVEVAEDVYCRDSFVWIQLQHLLEEPGCFRM